MITSKRNWKYLINPLDFIAGSKALLIGFGFLILGAVMAFVFNARFDGLLNLHFVEDISFVTAFMDLSINFIITTTCLFSSAYLFGAKQTRIIDVSAAYLLSFAPLSVLPILNLNNIVFNLGLGIKNQADIHAGDVGLLALITVLLLFALCWMITILFKGYKTATNLKDRRLIVSFSIALLLSLLVSKYITTLNLFS